MLSFSSGSWQSDLITAAGATKTVVKGRSHVATLILPRLYLSDVFTARDEKELKKLGITHVLTVMEASPTWSEGFETTFLGRMHVKVSDRPDTDILQWLDGTTEFIKSALESNEDNKVLVHCFQGMSRSATVVCAYLIATLGMTHTKSISFVKSKRGIVCPNAGFVKQLQIYATKYEDLRQAHGLDGVATKMSKLVKKMRGKTVTAVEETHVSSLTTRIGDIAEKDIIETTSVASSLVSSTSSKTGEVS